MAIGHGKDGVRINCIGPGYIDAVPVWVYFELLLIPLKVREAAGKLRALRGIDKREEVAAVFFASDDA